MGRDSSKASKEPNPVRIFNWLCTSSSSLSLSSGVPIDDELSDSPPAKNLGGPEIRKFDPSSFSGDPLRKIRFSEPPSRGGDEGTSMVKAGPTKTSIFYLPSEAKKMKQKRKNEAAEAAIQLPLSSSSSPPLRLPCNGVACHQWVHTHSKRTKRERERERRPRKNEVKWSKRKDYIKNESVRDRRI